FRAAGFLRFFRARRTCGFRLGFFHLFLLGRFVRSQVRLALCKPDWLFGELRRNLLRLLFDAGLLLLDWRRRRNLMRHWSRLGRVRRAALLLLLLAPAVLAPSRRPGRTLRRCLFPFGLLFWFPPHLLGNFLPFFFFFYFFFLVVAFRFSFLVARPPVAPPARV